MFGPPRVAITVGPSALDQPGLNAVHNGSLMTMFANPDTGDLVINYALPRPDLLGLVGPGTTLVRGRWSGDVFVGEARVFSLLRRCPLPRARLGRSEQRADAVRTGAAVRHCVQRHRLRHQQP